MIVFSEARAVAHSYIDQQIVRLTEEAKQNDIKVCFIPEDFDEVSAGDALAWCPYFQEETLGFVAGYIPTEQRYKQLYHAALEHNVRLINSPEQSDTIMDFEKFYPLIQDLTPESFVVNNLQDLKQLDMDFPLFIKGAIKSEKEKGWDACVAVNKTDLKKKCEAMFRRTYSARNKAVLRKIIPLKHTQKTPAGFPMGREFRVMLYQNQVIDYGYYWMTHGKKDTPSESEDKIIRELAVEASKRCGAPLIVVDVGQDIDNKWWVIETGDPQFCGVTHISGHVFWQHLKRMV